MAEITNRSLPVSEKEVELLKNTFKGNDYLLKIVRSLFYGFEISAEEALLVKNTFADKQLKEALRKKIYPLFDNQTPIGQLADFWIGIESQIFGASENTIYQAVWSKKKVLDLFQKAFALLDNPDGEKMDLTFDPEMVINDPLQVGLLARSIYIKSVETGLNFVQLSVNVEVESPKEVKKRLTKDSGE